MFPCKKRINKLCFPKAFISMEIENSEYTPGSCNNKIQDSKHIFVLLYCLKVNLSESVL